MITSDARLPSRIVRRAVSRAPSTFGGSAASIRRQVLALVMMPDSGWLTSCAIDAVKAPRLVTLATCRELRSGLPERLFREPALRHVLNRADVLQFAILVSRAVSDHMQVLDRLVGHQQPVSYSKSPPSRRARSMISCNGGMSSGWTRVPISSSVTGIAGSNSKMR